MLLTPPAAGEAAAAAHGGERAKAPPDGYGEVSPLNGIKDGW